MWWSSSSRTRENLGAVHFNWLALLTRTEFLKFLRHRGEGIFAPGDSDRFCAAAAAAYGHDEDDDDAGDGTR